MGCCCSKEDQSSLQDLVVSSPNSSDSSSSREQSEEASGHSSQNVRTSTASQPGNGESSDDENEEPQQAILDCILPRIQEDSAKDSHLHWARVYTQCQASPSVQDVPNHHEVVDLAGQLGLEVQETLYPFHVLSELGDPRWCPLVFFLIWHPNVHEDFMSGLSDAVSNAEDSRIKWKQSVRVLKQWQNLLPTIYDKMKETRFQWTKQSV